VIARVMLAFVWLIWLIPTVAWAQGPLTVTVTPTLNPLPIGLCGAVHLSVIDPATRDAPRNALGARVTIADFEMTVTGASVAGQQIDASHFVVCACQGGTAGSRATVIATYPARSLAQRAQVSGIPSQTQATFTIAMAKGGINPPACVSPTSALPRTVPPASPAATIASPASAAASSPVGGVRDPIRPVDPVAGVRDPSIRPVDPVPAPPVTRAVPLPETSAGTRGSGVATGAGVVAGGGALAGSARTPSTVGMINPSGLTAVQTGPGEVKLSWQPVAGVLGYGITGPGAAPVAPFSFATVAATTITMTNVPAGSQQWSVGSLYPHQGPQGVFEPPADATPVADFTKVTLTVTVAPKINPSGLTAVQTGPGEVKLSWQPVAGVLGYGITGPGAAPVAPFSFATVATTTITMTNVPAGSQQWSVGSLYPHQGPQGVFEPPVDASPVSDFTKVTLTVTAASNPKSNPSGLTAVQTGPGEVTLSWQPVAGALAYGVIGPGTPAPQAPLPFAGVTTTTMKVTNVPLGSQQWSVGALYPHQGPQGAFEPPVDFSPVTDFTKVTLTVTLRAGSVRPR
jgi:hypothetical protein